MLEIRKASAQDLPAIEEMVRLLFPAGRARFLFGDEILVAKIGGVPVGFCHFRIRQNRCYIAGLGVLPEYRRQGIGSKLLAFTIRLIDKKGVQSAFLKVRATNSATSLYLRFGFFEKKSGQTLLLVRKRQN